MASGGRERGAAAVEFALVVSVLIIPLVFGGLDLMLQTFARQGATEAAREAARYGILHPTDVPEMDTIARRKAATEVTAVSVSCLSGSTTAVKDCDDVVVDRDRVRVTVTVTSPIAWSPFHLGDITVSSNMVIVGVP